MGRVIAPFLLAPPASVKLAGGRAAGRSVQPGSELPLELAAPARGGDPLAQAPLLDHAERGDGLDSESLREIGWCLEAACPVIALLHDGDPEFVNEAAKRGIFAHVTDDDVAELQSTLDIVLRRFAEYHNLEGAFARRAMIEQAKGILMATHAIDEQEAFDLLRAQSQQTGTRLIDLAEAVVHSHRLLATRGPVARKKQ